MTVQNQDQALSQSERIFYSTIKADATKEHYKFYLKKYQAMYGYESMDQLLTKDSREIENQIIDCIMTLKDKNMKNAAISNYVKPVMKFCKLNRVVLNSDIINVHMPRRTKSNKTGAYTHEQIQQMIAAADKRISCVIHLLSSSGIRIGALPLLSFGNLEETKTGLYRITVYEGEEEQYITFCSPECKQAIIEYRQYRERYGEVITKHSPVIREQFDKRDQFSIQHPRRITEKALIVNLTVLLESVGIRNKVQLAEGQKPATVRSDIPVCNGFRRFFSSQCVNSDLNSEKRFLLEGHNLKFNDNSYVHVTDQLEKEYTKAIPNLTINQENKLKMQVKQLEENQDEISLMRLEQSKMLEIITKLQKESKERERDRIGRIISEQNLPEEVMKSVYEERQKANPGPWNIE